MKNSWINKALLFLPWVVAAAVLVATYTKPYRFWPGSTHWGYYSDSMTENHGNSTIQLLHADSNALTFQYTLRDKFQFPYIGITFEGENDSSWFDLHDYDVIEVDLEVQQSRRIPLVFLEFVPNHSRITNDLSFRPLTKEIECSTGRHTYTLDLDQLYVPAWWYHFERKTEKQLGKPRLEQIFKVQIHHCELLHKNTPETFTIHGLVCYKVYGWRNVWIWVISCLGVYYLGWFLYTRRKTIYRIIYPLQQIEVGKDADDEGKKIIDYLAHHYSNPDLSLHQLQQELGISETKISNVIKELSGFNFKKYLNILRITEACRLLKETNLPSMEIAYKVGYGNITHFNRVFKEMEGCSPTEYRKGNL